MKSNTTSVIIPVWQLGQFSSLRKGAEGCARTATETHLDALRKPIYNSLIVSTIGFP
ncbi:hypothetical protein [Prevotella corporis]|uniref:hypothetical protein n=1 Tax=Prevotella corporis TaxID=28128 RepID=UPI0023F133F8|nr:hypothetical protein [Prevotella corporis]